MQCHAFCTSVYICNVSHMIKEQITLRTIYASIRFKAVPTLFAHTIILYVYMNIYYMVMNCEFSRCASFYTPPGLIFMSVTGTEYRYDPFQ